MWLPELLAAAVLGPALRLSCIECLIAVGFSQFAVRPLAVPASWRVEIEALSAAVGDLRT